MQLDKINISQFDLTTAYTKLEIILTSAASKTEL